MVYHAAILVVVHSRVWYCTVDGERIAITARNTVSFQCSIRAASYWLQCPCNFPYHVLKPVRGTSDSATARESVTGKLLAALCFACAACQVYLHAKLISQTPCTLHICALVWLALFRSAYHVFEPVRATSDSAFAQVPIACSRLAAICFASLMFDVFLHARPWPHGPCAAVHCGTAQSAHRLTMPGSLCAAQKRGEPPGSPYAGVITVHPGSSHSLLLRFTCAML